MTSHPLRASCSGPGCRVVGKNGQKFPPGPDFVSVLLGHHARDLSEMPQVVHDPGCQQLPERNTPQARMIPRQIEVLLCNLPGVEQIQICSAQPGEFGKQGGQGAAWVSRPVAETLVGFEANGRPL